MDHEKIMKMAEKVKVLKTEAENLKNLSGGIQAVDRNVERILASVRMLELNICDLLE